MPDINVKANLINSFFVRPVIPWTCSKEKLDEAVEYARDFDMDDLTDGDALITAAMIMTIVYLSLILIPTFFIMCIVVKCREHCCLKVLAIVTLATEFAISLPVMILSIVAISKYQDKTDMIKKLDSLTEGCMDAYSDITDDVIRDQVEKPLDDATSAGIALSLFAAVVIIKITTILVFACYIRSQALKYMKSQK